MNYLQKQQITAVHNHYKRNMREKILQNITKALLYLRIKCKIKNEKNHVDVKFFDEKLWSS